MPWGTIAAAGLSAGLGAVGASKAAAANRRNRTRLLGSVGQARMLNADRFEEARSLLEANRGILDQGFNTAQSEVARSFTGAKQNILDREQQALGESESFFKSRGWGNSPNLIQGAANGIRMRTNRALSDIADMLAGRMAPLAIGRAQGQAGINNDIVRLLGAEAQMDTSQLNILSQYFGNTQAVSSPINLGGLGNALDQLIAQYGGGGPSRYGAGGSNGVGGYVGNWGRT